MERTLYLKTAYDGTNYHGWQNQPGFRTVQSVLEHAISRCVRHPVNLIGCGRTDSGVHALGHVSSFVTHCTLPSDKLRHSIESRLDDDIAIVDIRDVQPEFDARRSAISKHYRYRIFHAKHRPVEQLAQRYTFHYWKQLDVNAMQKAAGYFVGKQDFSSMASKSQERESMVREVLRCDVERRDDEIRIDVEGTGFLYRQVRNIAGTLIDVGRGRWEPQYVEHILKACDRSQAGGTAPAQGLCLISLSYPPELLLAPEPVTNPE